MLTCLAAGKESEDTLRIVTEVRDKRCSPCTESEWRRRNRSCRLSAFSDTAVGQSQKSEKKHLWCRVPAPHTVLPSHMTPLISMTICTDPGEGTGRFSPHPKWMRQFNNTAPGLHRERLELFLDTSLWEGRELGACPVRVWSRSWHYLCLGTQGASVK